MEGVMAHVTFDDLLDHAAEIDTAVKFGEFLMEQDQREISKERLTELAVECFCGRGVASEIRGDEADRG